MKTTQVSKQNRRRFSFAEWWLAALHGKETSLGSVWLKAERYTLIRAYDATRGVFTFCWQDSRGNVVSEVWLDPESAKVHFGEFHEPLGPSHKPILLGE